MLVQKRHSRQAIVPGSHDGGHSGVELSGESDRRGEHNKVNEAFFFAGRDVSPDL